MLTKDCAALMSEGCICVICKKEVQLPEANNDDLLSEEFTHIQGETGSLALPLGFALSFQS